MKIFVILQSRTGRLSSLCSLTRVVQNVKMILEAIVHTVHGTQHLRTETSGGERQMKKMYVLIGNYGSGKTELALNFAFKAAERGERTELLDLDMVNTYFRLTERGRMRSALSLRTSPVPALKRSPSRRRSPRPSIWTGTPSCSTSAATL